MSTRTLRTVSIAGVVVGTWCLAAGPASRLANHASPAAAVNRPAIAHAASAPAGQAARNAAPAAPKYPPQGLVKACEEQAESLRKRLDKSFLVTVRPPFVAAGNMSRAELDQYVDWSVVRPAKALWKGYFQTRPDKVITVLLFVGDEVYRGWAKRLYGDKDVAHFGYYKHEERTLVMNIATGSGTLVHELTHALIVYDFPDLPLWFNEGFASLHEQCNVGEDEIIGLTNWRLGGLQAAIASKKLRPLRDLVTQRDFYGPRQGLNYAQARYFCLYMQRQGRLKDFYAYLRKNHTGAGADAEAVEHVFGRKIEAIEPEFIEFVKTLRFPAD